MTVETAINAQLQALIDEAKRQNEKANQKAVNAIGDIWFRFEGRYTHDGSGDPEICIWRLPVVKLTPCGVWLDRGEYNGGKVFVVNIADHERGKRFAYRTREKAWDSFLIRTKRRLGYAQSNLNFCEKLQNLASSLSPSSFDAADEIRPGVLRSIPWSTK